MHGATKNSIILPILAICVAIAFISTVFLSPGTVSAGSGTRVRAALGPKIQKVDSALSRMARQHRFSGAILVARGGTVLLSKGYGLADRKRHIANSAATQFRIGTSTNQFTAMAILQLQAQGKLHVRDRICVYVAPCPKAWRSITIHELLTHTSGMAPFLERSDSTKPATPAQILAAAWRTPLIARPGSSWSYSNVGYCVLGYIIEKVSHQSYGAYLQQHIFAPAGMADSGYNDTAAKPAHLAVGYVDAVTQADYIDMSTAFSAAGVYSTVGDLYRWDTMLSSGKIASPKVIAKMFVPYWSFCANNCVSPPSDSEWGYKTLVSRAGFGYGWGVARLQRSHHRLFAAAGGFRGGLPYNGRYPDDKVVIIVQTNQDNVDIATVVRMLENAVLA